MENVKPRRDFEPPIAVYLLAADQFPFQRFHCMWCGLPVATIKGGVATVVDTPTEEALLGIGNNCKRCKQRYRFVLAPVLL